MLVSSQGYFNCLNIFSLLPDCRLKSTVFRKCLPLVILAGHDPIHLLESLLCALYKCQGSPSDLLSFPLKSNDWYSLKLELCRQPYILQDACGEPWIKACFTCHSRMHPHTNVWRAAFCASSRLCNGVEYAKHSIFSVHLILKLRGSFKVLGKQFPHWLLVCDLM